MESIIDFVRDTLGNPGLATLLSSPSFFFIQLMNSLSMGMYLFILAAGLSLIFGVLNVINFAHGAFYMFGAYTMYTVSQNMEMNFWLGVVAAGVVLAAMAVVIERGLFQFLYDKEHLMQLLLTFGVVLILGDLAKAIWGTDQLSVSYPPGMDGATNLGVTYYPTYRLVLCLIGPLIAVGLWYLIEKTRWGRVIRGATQDREMLAALGINVPFVYTSVFVLGSMLAGIGGALSAPFNSPTPGMDATIIVDCFVIVIIGGLGSLWGTFIGALIYGIVWNFGSVILPNGQDVFAFVLLMIVLLVRPWGLFGRPITGGH